MKFLYTKSLLGRLFTELHVLDKVKSTSDAEVLYLVVKEDIRRYICDRQKKKFRPFSIREFFTNQKYRQMIREKIMDEITELNRTDKSISQYIELV